MRVQTAQRLGGIGHLAFHIRAGNRAGVAHLPTAFPIKRSLVGDHCYRVIRNSCLHFDAIIDEGKHLTFTFAGGVTGEFCRTDSFGNIEPHIVGCFGARSLPCSPRAFFLRRHGSIEAFGIDTETLGAKCVFG